MILSPTLTDYTPAFLNIYFINNESKLESSSSPTCSINKV